MDDTSITEIKGKIIEKHKGDKDQLKVIFSDNSRIIVEAPAGYGKTTTMVSRIAYLFATGKIPNPKKILGLTFSINAALKIKRDVAVLLPELIGIQNNPIAISEKTIITNYHGFCKRILNKYGYLLAPVLKQKEINSFRAINCDEIRDQLELRDVLTVDEKNYLESLDIAIQGAQMPDQEAIHNYNEIIIEKFLPLSYITYNAIILFVLEIFEKYTEVKKFYQSFFALIVVDEFQDTNCIALALLEAIISDRTQLLCLGDPLQRIYGFIGALPDIMSIVAQKYNMTEIVLTTNYRFQDSPEMLKLDKNIRYNADSAFKPVINSDDIADLPYFWGENQQDEAEQISEKVSNLIREGDKKIALLFRARSKNVEIIENKLISKKIPYFYGMFKDDDLDYINFHNTCHETLLQMYGIKKIISQQMMISFSKKIKANYASNTRTPIIISLIRLLDALIDRVTNDYKDLTPEDKYALLLEIFENRQLKQAMEYVDSRVVLSTVHGAKGLEWDYVILGDVERWIFPGPGLCSNCESWCSTVHQRCCKLPNSLSKKFENDFLNELSVFYVGVTRAKKQVYVSASATRFNRNNDEKESVFSCLTGLSGIKLVNTL